MFRQIVRSVYAADGTQQIEFSLSGFRGCFAKDGGYPDLFVAIEDNPETVRRMIEEGADVNQLVNNGTHSPLHHALENEAFPAARLLIEHGADVLYKNPTDNITPVHLICCVSSNYRASEEDRYEVCKLLVQKGAECNSRDRHGYLQLHFALMNRCLNLVKFLLEHGADITAIDIPDRKCTKRTALHWAASNPHVNVIEFLMNQGFDIKCTDRYGRSLLYHAAAYNNSKVCELLLKHGLDVDSGSNWPNGDTVLSMAVGCHLFDNVYISEKPRLIRVLLEHGANVAHKVIGRSVFEIAATTASQWDRRHHRSPSAQNLLSYADDIRYVLMWHVAKMDYTNLSIDESDRQTIETNRVYQRYYEFCVEELGRMKNTNIYNDVSVFNLLLDNERIIPRYAGNEEFVRALESRDYGKEFPIYFKWLQKRFYVGVEKNELWKTASVNLSMVLNLNDGMHLVTQNILRNIHLEELKSLCPNFVPKCICN